MVAGETTRQAATAFHIIDKVLFSTGDYGRLQSGSTVWARIKDRDPLAGPVVPVEFECEATASSIPAVRFDALEARYRASKYGQHVERSGAALPYATLSAMPDARKAAVFTPEAWYDISSALSLSHPSYLSAMIQKEVLPLLFRWRPDSVFRAYLGNGVMESRASLMRMLRVVHEYEVLSIGTNTPESLSVWQSSMPVKIFQGILDWVSLWTYPHINFFTAGPVGLVFVYCADGLDQYKPSPFPQTSLSLKRGHAYFGREDTAQIVGPGTIRIAKHHMWGKYTWEMDKDRSVVLLDWAAAQANRLVRAMFDLTRFEVPHAAGEIDFVLAQEQMWTIDRILRRTIQIQSAEFDWPIRTQTFEIADLWSEVMWRWLGKDEAAMFRLLFAPAAGAKHVKSCLAGLPTPWRERLERATDEVYSLLLKAVQDSIWCLPLKSAKGVQMRNDKGAVTTDLWEEFVPSLIRDLRNTHHGYMPDRSKSRSRLILSTGAIPEALSFLPTLWLAAFLANPKQFSGWPADVSGY